MIKLILVALAPVAGIVLFVLNRWFSKGAKLRKLERKLVEVKHEANKALVDNRLNDYYRLDAERVRLAKEIRRLRR